MELRNKKILIISPEPWSEVFVSKHHYAIELAKRDNEVFFLNPPSGTFTKSPTPYKNVYQLNYPGFPKGIRFYPSLLQKFFFKKELNRIKELIKAEIDIVWSFDTSVFFDFSSFPSHVFKISHIVDLNQDFELPKAASTANVCFCTSEYIKRRLIEFNNRVYKVNHGYKPIKQTTFPSLPGKNKIKAVYVGNLGIKYFDWELFHELAAKHKEVDFILIGPNRGGKLSKASKETKNTAIMLANVYSVGPLSSEKVAGFLKMADVLLVLYLSDLFKEQLANPHKLMEYLSSGKVIVSTWIEEFKQKRTLIEMSEKNADYPALFEKVLLGLEYYNNKKLERSRVEYALDNTYAKQIDRIQRVIESSL